LGYALNNSPTHNSVSNFDCECKNVHHLFIMQDIKQEGKGKSLMCKILPNYHKNMFHLDYHQSLLNI
jgi:hypothetical protein